MKIDSIKLELAIANKGFSVRELANICGVNEVTISKMRKGGCKTRLKTLGKIAKALNCDVSELIEK